MPIMLEVQNLFKAYDDLKAVDGVSFSISEGTCFGLLGPNGAGKTTTIEMIEDIITPTDGEILYQGAERSAAFKEEIGIQFQQTALLAYLSVYETLETFQSLYLKTENLDDLMEICHLNDIRDQMNDSLSGGQRQRLLLALALINAPRLIFLDEPSTGLDPQARRNLWHIIDRIKEQGKTVILTTHYMEEAQYLCDEIAIMDYGKIIAQGTPAELIARHCDGETIVLPKKNVAQPLKELDFQFYERQGHIEIPTTDVNRILNQLMKANVDMTEMTIKMPNLEEVFLNLTGRRLRT
ncbi:ABC transporter ATP-binding protein [Thermodesulfobacteriota bacterium]